MLYDYEHYLDRIIANNTFTLLNVRVENSRPEQILTWKGTKAKFFFEGGGDVFWIREAAKKGIFLLARPLRPYSPHTFLGG